MIIFRFVEFLAVEKDGILRAVLYTSHAAIALMLKRRRIVSHHDVIRLTYLLANTAACTFATDTILSVPAGSIIDYFM